MSTLTAESPFLRRARRPAPRIRLFCLPYGGAGASMFSAWPDLLPDDIEVVAVQLPGREDRQTEMPLTDDATIARVLSRAMRPYLRSPYALFGYCAGALGAFEVARQLARWHGRGPSHLFVAAQNAPHLPSTAAPLHNLPDGEFLTAVRGLGGIDPQVAGNDEMVAIVLNALRADFTAWEGYRYVEGDRLSCAITVFGGTGDPRTDEAGLVAWRHQTDGPVTVRMLPAGHFFTGRDEATVLRTIAAELGWPEGTRGYEHIEFP